MDIDQVRFPDGTNGELEIVRHSGASAIVPLLDDGETRVLLIRQYRYAANGYVFEIPAGRLNPGESPEMCASRELREETGYSAATIRKLTMIYTTPGFTDEKIHLFIAEGLTLGSPERESDEFLEVYSVPLLKAVAMIKSGDIVDGKTSVGLLLTYLNQNSK